MHRFGRMVHESHCPFARYACFKQLIDPRDPQAVKGNISQSHFIEKLSPQLADERREHTRRASAAFNEGVERWQQRVVDGHGEGPVAPTLRMWKRQRFPFEVDAVYRYLRLAETAPGVKRDLETRSHPQRSLSEAFLNFLDLLIEEPPLLRRCITFELNGSEWIPGAQIEPNRLVENQLPWYEVGQGSVPTHTLFSVPFLERDSPVEIELSVGIPEVSWRRDSLVGEEQPYPFPSAEISFYRFWVLAMFAQKLLGEVPPAGERYIRAHAQLTRLTLRTYLSRFACLVGIVRPKPSRRALPKAALPVLQPPKR